MQTLTKPSWIHPRTGTQEQEGGGVSIIDGDLLFGCNIRAGRNDNTNPPSKAGADEVMLSVKAKKFNLGSIRAENLVSHSLRVH